MKTIRRDGKMREYSVKKNNVQFTVLVNEKDCQKEQEFFDEVSQDYGVITDILMNYENIPAIYRGKDEDGWSVIDFAGKERAIISPETPVNIDTTLKLASKLFQKNIYRVETESGRVFYEACNDMNEKKDLYKDLGAKVSCEVRYTKNTSEPAKDVRKI